MYPILMCLNNNLKKTLKINNIITYEPGYNSESSGLDLYNTSDEPILVSRNKILIPTGLKIIVPIGYTGLIKERGSIKKTPLTVHAGVIDPGYTGEIFVMCSNLEVDDDIPYLIPPQSKLPFQLLIVQSNNMFIETDEATYLKTSENLSRKTGNIGSTDRR